MPHIITNRFLLFLTGLIVLQLYDSEAMGIDSPQENKSHAHDAITKTVEKAIAIIIIGNDGSSVSFEQVTHREVPMVIIDNDPNPLSRNKSYLNNDRKKLIEVITIEDDDENIDSGYHPPSDSQPTNLCRVCDVDMGSTNPRQYCQKTFCPEQLLSADSPDLF